MIEKAEAARQAEETLLAKAQEAESALRSTQLAEKLAAKNLVNPNSLVEFSILVLMAAELDDESADANESRKKKRRIQSKAQSETVLGAGRRKTISSKY